MLTPLQKYFAQRVKNLFNHLHDFELNGDEVSMHDFRVELKKMRSIVRFLEQIYPKPKLKRASHLLRNIFQVAGEIREYQLLQQWLQKGNFFVLEKEYYPPERLNNMVEAFRMRADDYKTDLNEIIETVGHYVHSTNEILAEQYYTDMNAQVENMTRRNLPQIDWHELRKLIKQRIYSFNWVRHEDNYEDNAFAYYNKLQETIGQWHDLEIIKDNFSQKQVWLSQDIEVQKDFNLAWDKLTTGLKQKERVIEDMLATRQAEVKGIKSDA
ncbi:CHAD domain-containing protein [Foetidibacter luteolus]|uniref:CHAD domain-containing protein n=1 Tax=Foetidibacter luteolus TaxID=2608880 RepID=UPI00129A6253|nr:CHAD domain-containing protein [Foetidibacter luteolus]